MVKEIKYNRFVSDMHTYFYSLKKDNCITNYHNYRDNNGNTIITICQTNCTIIVNNSLKYKYKEVDVLYEVGKFITFHYGDAKIRWNN